jgi:hypothetical protein
VDLKGGTRGWQDPDWHHRICWNIVRAKGADMYSLGLLLLWLFFHDSQMLPDMSKLPHTENDKIGTVKLACKLVNLQQTQNIRFRAVLKLLFVTCLGPNPEKRALPFDRDLSSMCDFCSEEEENTIINMHRCVQAESGLAVDPLVELAILLKRYATSPWSAQGPMEKRDRSAGHASLSPECRARQLNVSSARR